MSPRFSIKTYLILASAGITSGLLFLFYLGSAVLYNSNQREQLDVFLHTEGTGIAAMLTTFLSHEKVGAIRENGLLRDPNFTRLMAAFLVQREHKPLTYPATLVIADSSGAFISSTDQTIHIDPGFLAKSLTDVSDKRAIGKDATVFSVHYQKLDYRVLETPIELDGRLIGTVRLACLLDPVTKSCFHFLLMTGLFFVISVLLNGISTILLVTRVLKPVRKMSTTMNRISEGDFSSRLEQLPGNDEFSTLATTFNHALDRLENAHRFQEQLVSDLSHQLRTPLTSMRGMVEVAMGKPRSGAEYQAVLESNMAEIDRITSLVNTMLTLAKLDGQIERLQYTRCDLVALLEEIIRELAPLWDAKSIRFLYRFFPKQGMVEFIADEGSVPQLPAWISDLFVIEVELFRFKQAIINILDNAYKYTPVGGQISIELYSELAGHPGCSGFVIMNNGPAFSPGVLPHLFTRFFQNDLPTKLSDDPPSDSDGAGEITRGFGLGLSIARRIVEMHQGRIRAFNPMSGGAAFEIILPNRRPELG